VSGIGSPGHKPRLVAAYAQFLWPPTLARGLIRPIPSIRANTATSFAGTSDKLSDVGECIDRPVGARLVVTPCGTPVEVPVGWLARPADNGNGTVYQRPGAQGNSDSIRVMDPTTTYPDGYVVLYNRHGQPVKEDGRPGIRSETHISLGRAEPVRYPYRQRT